MGGEDGRGLPLCAGGPGVHARRGRRELIDALRGTRLLRGGGTTYGRVMGLREWTWPDSLENVDASPIHVIGVEVER